MRIFLSSIAKIYKYFCNICCNFLTGIRGEGRGISFSVKVKADCLVLEPTGTSLIITSTGLGKL